jgi:hypothetical protein
MLSLPFTDLAGLVLWLGTNAGAGTVAWAIMNLAWFATWSPFAKRLGSLGVAAGCTLIAFFAGVALGLTPEPATTMEWINGIFSALLVGLSVAYPTSQIAHGLQVLRGKKVPPAEELPLAA